jgi:N-acetylmuramoyl-L-alanine amidase
MRFRQYICLTLLILSAQPALAVDQVSRVTLSGAGRQATTLYAMQTRGVQYVPLLDLADFLQCRVYSNPQYGKIEIYPEQRRIKVSGDNPFVMIDGQTFQLRREILSINNTLYVPLAEFMTLLDRHLSGEFAFDADSGTALAEIPTSSISALTIEEKANGTLLRIHTNQQFGKPSHYYDHRDNWLYIQIPGGRIEEHLFQAPAQTALLRETRVEQLADMAQVAVRLSRKIPNPQVWQDQRSKDIFVSLADQSAPPMPTVNLASLLRSQQQDWDFDTIVLDAGHGGKDPGVVYGRLQEKRFNLDIVKRLGKLLEAKKRYNVVYTRNNDTFIDLTKRTKIANDAKGKMFISIHTNSTSSRTTSANGFEVYILGTRRDKNATALRVAQRENQVALDFEDDPGVYEKMSEAQLMKLDIMESGFLRESEDLAAVLSTNMAQAAKSRTRGVKQAFFWVLVGASMPRVLIEVGYINNSRDRKNLDNSKYRQMLAEGIFAGIQEFVQQHRRVIARQEE